MNETASVNANCGPPLIARNRWPSRTKIPYTTSSGVPEAVFRLSNSIVEFGKIDV